MKSIRSRFKRVPQGRRAAFGLLAAGAMCLLVISSPVLRPSLLAQTGGGYGLSWWTIDGGGGRSTGGNYGMSGTVGQLDAGVLSGGVYRLLGGFWPGMSAVATPTVAPTATGTPATRVSPTATRTLAATVSPTATRTPAATVSPTAMAPGSATPLATPSKASTSAPTSTPSRSQTATPFPRITSTAVSTAPTPSAQYPVFLPLLARNSRPSSSGLRR